MNTPILAFVATFFLGISAQEAQALPAGTITIENTAPLVKVTRIHIIPYNCDGTEFDQTVTIDGGTNTQTIKVPSLKVKGCETPWPAENPTSTAYSVSIDYESTTQNGTIQCNYPDTNNPYTWSGTYGKLVVSVPSRKDVVLQPTCSGSNRPAAKVDFKGPKRGDEL